MAKKLIAEIEKKLNNWNERSSFKIKGVGNLSRSDLDTLVLYAETWERQGNFRGLMAPRGSIEQILAKYGMKEENGFYR